MFTISSDFERPPEELVAAIRELPPSAISDAMGRTGGMDAGIKPLDPRMRLAGAAFTVRAYPADNFMCHLAVRLAMPGDVLVVDASGFLGAALWGELTSLAAMKKGLAGIIIDGAVRDQLAICDMGFPVFARGCTPAGTFKANLGNMNVPITCGGMAVSPGDVVVGDADGVVVVPRDLLDTVLTRAREVVAKETALRAKIRAGDALFDILGLKDVLQRQGFVLE